MSAATEGGVSRVVVMGVAGCGKSTLGAALATALRGEFIEGDTLHPPANLERMRRGEPLDDEARAPWLAAVGAVLARASDGAVVVSCSALKRRYRDQLRAACPTLRFVHLVLDRETLAERLVARTGHFAGVTLLDSQLATLEPLSAEEPTGLALDGALEPARLVERAVEWLEAQERG